MLTILLLITNLLIMVLTAYCAAVATSQFRILVLAGTGLPQAQHKARELCTQHWTKIGC